MPLFWLGCFDGEILVFGCSFVLLSDRIDALPFGHFWVRKKTFGSSKSPLFFQTNFLCKLGFVRLREKKIIFWYPVLSAHREWVQPPIQIVVFFTRWPFLERLRRESERGKSLPTLLKRWKALPSLLKRFEKKDRRKKNRPFFLYRVKGT